MKKTFPLTKVALMGIALSCLSHAARADYFQPTSADWRGPYVGASVGGAWSDFRNYAGRFGPSGSDSSFLGGVDLGNNWQMNKIVYGFEADLAGLNNKSDSNGIKFHEDWMSTFRGRIGFDVMNQWLPYATGGLALTGLDSRVSGVGSNHDVDPGYTVGGGVDGRISNHWIGRIEYLYVDVPKDSSTIGGLPLAGGSSNNILRVGLNYKF